MLKKKFNRVSLYINGLLTGYWFGRMISYVYTREWDNVILYGIFVLAFICLDICSFISIGEE